MLPKIAGKGLSLLTIIEYFSLSLAWILALAVPMAVLIATLAAFGRLAGDGEITALRASGISPGQLIKPVMIAGFFMTVWVFYFNNFLLPDLNHRTKLLQIDISRKKPTFNLESNIFNFDIPNYVMLAKEVDSEKDELYDVTIYDTHNANEQSTITAQKGKLGFVKTEEAVKMTLYEGEIHKSSKKETHGYQHTVFDSANFRMKIPGMVLKRGRTAGRGERELTVQELFGRFKALSKKTENYNIRRRSIILVEIHKKFSIPAACLVFVLLGAPLGMLSRKGGMGVAGGISLLFFTIYWACLGAGEDLADRGRLSPAISMWMANIGLTIAGLIFLIMAHRKTSLPGVSLISNLIERFFLPATLDNESDSKSTTPPDDHRDV